MSENQKIFFSRSISPFEALQLILGSKMILNDQKWISKRYVFFTFRSKFSTFFGKNMELTNVFCRNFWPIGQIFGQISTSENSKFEEILGKNCKFRLLFFSNVSGGRPKCQKIKKTFFSRSISPFKALQLILESKMIWNGQISMSKVIRSYFSLLGQKKNKIFRIFW